MIKAVFATDLAGGFGIAGGLPWPSIKEDFKHFRDVTMNSYVVMGYSTYSTLPTLKNRTPIVVLDPERQKPFLNNPPALFTWRETAKTELRLLAKDSPSDVIIIGGTSLLTPEYLELCGEIYHTEVQGTYDVDTKIPKGTLHYLSKLNSEVLLETDNCIIRKFTR